MACDGMCLSMPWERSLWELLLTSSSDQTAASTCPPKLSTFPSFAEGCWVPGALGRSLW